MPTAPERRFVSSNGTNRFNLIVALPEPPLLFKTQNAPAHIEIVDTSIFNNSAETSRADGNSVLIPFLINKMASKDKNPEVPVAIAANVIDQPIVAEMRQSYIDYAMTVITARALPDVRDGLKPVHRRILYAMKDMGLVPGGKFRKSRPWSAKCSVNIIRTAMSRSTTLWRRWRRNFRIAIRSCLGQGNFGSIDGDRPAAMRYTEAKMSRIAEALLYRS